MKHVCIDLETMGTRPGCAIVSIGAVEFELDGRVGDKFYSGVDLASCVKIGLEIEPKTVMWWMMQGSEAREKIFGDNPLVEKVLKNFSTFINDRASVWGNSASFDCSILAEVYRKCGIEIPWNVFNEKCYRTIKNLFPGNYPKKDSARSHDPIYDCEYQIDILQGIWKRIKFE